MLRYYGTQFRTVEINNTFYRFPMTSLLENWRDSTPDDFIFAVKAVQRITHKARLKDVEDLNRDFIGRCRLLADKLGPILYQLPPYLKRDDERLGQFLEGLDPRLRYAFEFRHASWFTDPVFELLSDAGAALCVSQGEKLDTPRVATGRYVYVRLRKDAYTDEELADWHAWMAEQVDAGRSVFAYLKHDEEGASPEYALRLLAGG